MTDEQVLEVLVMILEETETITWPQNFTSINVNRECELQFWSKKFQVSKGKLKQAVRAVGPNFKDVKEHLDSHR